MRKHHATEASNDLETQKRTRECCSINSCASIMQQRPRKISSRRKEQETAARSAHAQASCNRSFKRSRAAGKNKRMLLDQLMRKHYEAAASKDLYQQKRTRDSCSISSCANTILQRPQKMSCSRKEQETAARSAHARASCNSGLGRSLPAGKNKRQLHDQLMRKHHATEASNDLETQKRTRKCCSIS